MYRRDERFPFDVDIGGFALRYELLRLLSLSDNRNTK
jgi:hypothetical protein